MPQLGFNERMTDMQAALALCQLKRADKMILDRREKAAYYDQALADTPQLKLPFQHSDYGQNYQSYVVQLAPTWLQREEEASLRKLQQRRNAILKQLHSAGVMARIGAYAFADVAYYKNKYGMQPMHYPGSFRAAVSTIALPIYPSLKLAEQDHVVNTLKTALARL